MEIRQKKECVCPEEARPGDMGGTQRRCWYENELSTVSFPLLTNFSLNFSSHMCSLPYVHCLCERCMGRNALLSHTGKIYSCYTTYTYRFCESTKQVLGFPVV